MATRPAPSLRSSTRKHAGKSPSSRARRSREGTPALPSPSATRRADEKEATRAKILAAARKLFVRHGFEAVSMRQIAGAIKYTPGALYAHFTDKLDLIFAMMQQDFRAFDAGMEEAMRISDPVHRLRELGRGYVRFALAHPHHYKLMFMTEPPDFGAQRQLGAGVPDNCEHANSDREGYNACRMTVAACIEQGRFAPHLTDVELVSQATWGCVHGVASLFITHGKQPWAKFSDPLRAADMAIDVHLAGMTRGARVPTHFAMGQPVEPEAASPEHMRALRGNEGSDS